MTIDLCVTSYNTADKLDRLLGTLKESTPETVINPPVWRLHIMDNGSTDGSKELLQRWANYLPADTIIVYGENIGYSAACNDLAAMGDGSIVALLNADIWFTYQDLIKIKETFDHYPNQAIMGPKQRDEQGRVRAAGVMGTNTNPVMRGWGDSDPDDKLYRDRQECVTISGSAYFVRREVWRALTTHPDYQSVAPGAKGAFLPTPHYYEETWCSYFARHIGLEVWYDGSISIGHSWHASSPIGGEADKKFKISQKIFREACDKLGIEHD